jgi:ATP-dependent protease ClpP protease subunit
MILDQPVIRGENPNHDEQGRFAESAGAATQKADAATKKAEESNTSKDHRDAKKAHKEAVEEHDKAAEQARKDGDTKKAGEHEQKAAEHRVKQREHRIAQTSRKEREEIEKFKVERENACLTVLNDGGDPFTIELIGSVGSSPWSDGGITEMEFRDALKQVPVGKPINLNINSEGGSVQEGLGIYNAIKERSEQITCRITGYAMSIASVFPLAAGKVISPRSAIWMMHKASSWSQGNADDMRQAAKMLDAHDETLVDIYAAETGKSKAEIRSAMEAVTWIKGSEAVAFGLADEGDEEEVMDAATYRPLAQAFLDRCKVPAAILNCIQAAAPISISAAHNGGQPKNATQTDIMNKKTIVALLKKHGIEATETETEEQLQTKLDSIPTAAANPAVGAAATKTNADIIDIRLQLLAQNRKRITDKVSAYIETFQITKAEVALFVEAAIKDEEGTLAILSARPVAEVGGEPVGFNRVEGGNSPVLDGYQGRATEMVVNLWKEHKTPAARYEALKQDYHRIVADAFGRDRKAGVRNENTFAAGITTNFLIVGAITKLGPQVAALRAFSRDNSVDPFKPLATGVQKFNTTVQDGSDTLTDATDFSTGGDSTLTGPTIAVHQYTQTMHLTNAQLNSGIRMADLIEAKLGSLKSKIAQVVTAPITIGNFGTLAGTTGAILPLVSAPEAFGFSDLATLQGALKKSGIKNVILDGEYIARIANTPGFFQAAGIVGGMEGAWKAFGWDLIALLTEWSGAAANVRGFACNPQAIGVIAGLPLNPVEGIPGNVIQTGQAMLAGPDIAIATYLWMDANARTMRASYDLMLGAAAVDTSAGAIVKSA